MSYRSPAAPVRLAWARAADFRSVRVPNRRRVAEKE